MIENCFGWSGFTKTQRLIFLTSILLTQVAENVRQIFEFWQIIWRTLVYRSSLYNTGIDFGP